MGLGSGPINPKLQKQSPSSTPRSDTSERPSTKPAPEKAKTKKEIEALKQQHLALSKEFDEYSKYIPEVENERDFYFNKLRNIKNLCQRSKVADPKLRPFSEKVFQIIYADKVVRRNTN